MQENVQTSLVRSFISLSTLGTSEVVVPLKMVISAYYDNDQTRVARSVGSKHLPV